MQKNLKIASLVVFSLAVAFPVFAQGLAQPSNYGLPDASNGGGVAGLINTIVLFILAIAGSIAVLFIIIGGFQYILSGANEALAKRGRTTLVNAIIGLIIIILSYTVITVVSRVITSGRAN